MNSHHIIVGADLCVRPDGTASVETVGADPCVRPDGTASVETVGADLRVRPHSTGAHTGAPLHGRALASAVLLAVLVTTGAWAAPPDAVPSFSLVTLAGEAASSDVILGSRPWLLGFVGPGNASREMVFAIQTPSPSPTPSPPLPPGGGEDKGGGVGRLVLIVRGDAAAARQIVGATLRGRPDGTAPVETVGADLRVRPDDGQPRGVAPTSTPAIVWYADPTGQAARAMGVKGVPALFGVDERNVIRWRMDGPLLKPGEVRSLIEKWGGGESVNR